MGIADITKKKSMNYYPAFQTALKWRDNGVSCIPCSWNTKIPIIKWGGYRDKLPTETQLENWFGVVRTNLAIITGGITSLAVLDFDSYALYRKWIACKPKYKESFTVATPRPGRHIYFRIMSNGSSRLSVVSGLDIKSNGGYVLGYPSYSKSKPYLIDKDTEIQTVNSIDDILLDEWIVDHSSTVKPRINDVRGDGTSGISNIKERYPIYDVICQYTNLRSTSSDGRWYIGKCPAHSDNGPSLRVDTKYNRCYCWSDKCRLHQPCGCDVIDFYAIVNNISNLDAIIELG